MKCPQCDFENEEDNKFCSKCNTPLAETRIPDATENPYIKANKEETNAPFLESKKTLYSLKEPFNKIRSFSKVRFFSKDWFFALWQGERPLWEAWWVLGLVVILLAYTLRYFFNLYYWPSRIYYICFGLFIIFLQIFYWIAAWRCAPNVHYKVWFYIARFIILVAVLRFLGELYIMIH